MKNLIHLFLLAGMCSIFLCLNQQKICAQAAKISKPENHFPKKTLPPLGDVTVPIIPAFGAIVEVEDVMDANSSSDSIPCKDENTNIKFVTYGEKTYSKQCWCFCIQNPSSNCIDNLQYHTITGNFSSIYNQYNLNYLLSILCYTSSSPNTRPSHFTNNRKNPG